VTVYRDPKTQKRLAVLRPNNPALSLRRLAEWNRLMDKASDAVSKEQGAPFFREADALWVAMKKEQAWTFLGWLGTDTKTIVGDEGKEMGQAAPGDMHEPEDRLKGWR